MLPQHRFVAVLALVAIVSLVLSSAPAVGAQQDDDLAATVEVREVRGAALESGGNAMVAYTAEHEVRDTIDPGDFLPGAVVSTDDHPDAFAGIYGRGVQMGAWLPDEAVRSPQYRPASDHIESLYYSNRLRGIDLNAVPLEPGDYVEFAMANAAGDAPLPYDRERGDTDGELAWDVATDTRTVASRYGGDEAELDVLFVRADIVARGGDVDARAEPVDLPPLVLDLPRPYLEPVSNSGLGLIFHPYTEYVDEFSIKSEPALGKATITASAAGYLPEAREHVLDNGTTIREWHIPLTVAFVVGRGGAVPAAVSLTAPAEAEAVVVGSTAARRLTVPAGSSVQAGTAFPAEVVGGETEQSPPPEALPDELADVLAAASVTRDLDEPVTVSLAGSGVHATIDPDYRKTGVLAVRAAGTEDGQWAELAALPYVVIDGEPVRLDRSRLTDLRVSNRHLVFWYSLISTAIPPPWPAHSVLTAGYDTGQGLFVEAVYDLGGDLRVIVEFWGVPGKDSTQLLSYARFLRLSRQTFEAHPVHYLEPGQVGEVRFDGAPATHEFTADRQGDVEIERSTITGGMGQNRGRFTVLRATAAALDPRAAPDPDVPLGTGPVAVLYRASTPQLAISYGSLVRVRLHADGGPPPAPDPPPLGVPCGDPPFRDAADPTVPAQLDVTDGWLDADEANVYASLRLGEVPTEPLAGSTYRYSLHWRVHHTTYFARASLDADGQWSWDAGVWGGDPPAFHSVADDRVTGEVQPGAEGVVRISLSRDLFARPLTNGDLLRDTAGHAVVERELDPAGILPAVGARHHADAAPAGSTLRFGTGDDYMVDACEDG